MRAIASHFGSRENDLKSEMGFDLAAQPLQRLAKKLFHLAATEANDVRVLLLAAGFVVMLLAGVVMKLSS